MTDQQREAIATEWWAVLTVPTHIWLTRFFFFTKPKVHLDVVLKRNLNPVRGSVFTQIWRISSAFFTPCWPVWIFELKTIIHDFTSNLSGVAMQCSDSYRMKLHPHWVVQSGKWLEAELQIWANAKYTMYYMYCHVFPYWRTATQKKWKQLKGKI